MKYLQEYLRPLGTGSIKLNLKEFDGIATIHIDNSKKKNALSGKMMAELADVVEILEKEPQEKTSSIKSNNQPYAVILSGENNTFCAGFGMLCNVIHY